MKLIYKPENREVKLGDLINHDNCPVEIIYCPQPHKPSSEGKMQVKFLDGEETTLLYCSCFDCEWIDREDRLEEPQPTQVGGFSDFKPDWSSLEVFPSAPIKPIYKDTSSLPSVSSFDRTAQLMAEVEDELNRIQETLQQIKSLLS